MFLCTANRILCSLSLPWPMARISTLFGDVSITGTSLFLRLHLLHFLLVPFHGLATLVFSVPMCCHSNCLFLNLVLYHGSLFQPVLCETIYGNLPFILFKFGQPAFHIDVFVEALCNQRCSMFVTSPPDPKLLIHFSIIA
jgi:hypothetical protein